MSSYDKELESIHKLEAEARERREKLPKLLKHPDYWRPGMRVRYVRSVDEWGPQKGWKGTVVDVRDPDTPGSDYQVFWVSPDGSSSARYWTTPDDVELE